MCMTLQELQNYNWIGEDLPYQRKGNAVSWLQFTLRELDYNTNIKLKLLPAQQEVRLKFEINNQTAQRQDIINCCTAEAGWQTYMNSRFLWFNEPVQIDREGDVRQQLFNCFDGFTGDARIQAVLSILINPNAAPRNAARPVDNAPAPGHPAQADGCGIPRDYADIQRIEGNFIAEFNRSLADWNIDDESRRRLRIDENGTMDENHPLFNIFYVCNGDVENISAYNRQCLPEHHIYRYFPQEGICGDPETARILIFSNNPGASNFWDNNGAETIRHVINMLRENFEAGHDFTGVLPSPGNNGWAQHSFAPLYNTYIGNAQDTTNYWKDKLLGKDNSPRRFLLSPALNGDRSPKNVNAVLSNHRNYIMTLELFGYHSEIFDRSLLSGRSVSFGFFRNHMTILRGRINQLIDNAMNRDRILLFARGYANWVRFLGHDRMADLENYNHFFRLSSSNVTISENNVIRNGQRAFDQLLAQYQNLTPPDLAR